MRANIYIWTIILLAWCAEIKAQSIEGVLKVIEANNLNLKAGRENANALKLELKSQNSLEDPTIDYSPFFAKSVKGVVSSEMVVRQGFDFPTLYSVRRKTNRIKNHAIDRKWQVERCNLLLNAKLLCIDMVRLSKMAALLDKQKMNADTLLSVYQKRLEEGDANIIEVNKIRMKQMDIHTESMQNEAELSNVLQQLLAMNANKPLPYTDLEYPEMENADDYRQVYDEFMSTDVALAEADANWQVAEKMVSVNKQQWLPKLAVGYRRNTSLDESSNGFMISGSIPLFSNRDKIRKSRAEAVSARLNLDHLRLQAENNVKAKFNEAASLRQAMGVYDMELMKNTLGQLAKAVDAGMISIIEYYIESDNVYKNMYAYINLEARYYSLLSEIYKNRL